MVSEKKKKRRALTSKQLKFIQAYAGNGADAARIAGYKGDDHQLAVAAYDNLTNPDIRKAIKRRTDGELEPIISTRMSRQKFWDRVMRNPKVSMKERLRASELLGKSYADFIDVVKSSGTVKTEIRLATDSQVEDALEKFEKDY